MNIASFILLFMMSFAFINTYAVEQSMPALNNVPQKVEWQSQHVNHPFQLEIPTPATINGEVSKDSGVSARIECVGQNDQMTRWLVYRGGTFVCHNTKKISITSTGASAHAKGFFTISPK